VEEKQKFASGERRNLGTRPARELEGAAFLDARSSLSEQDSGEMEEESEI